MPTSQRRKSATKTPLQVSERIRKHFKSLVAQIDGGHLKNGIKTCDKILRLEPNDQDALQSKLSLLLRTNQYALALALSESLLGTEQHPPFSVVFGKAYALYRLNREPEATETLQHLTPEGRHEEQAVMHIKAQIEYRCGNYQKAQDLYSQIFDSSLPYSDEQSDTLTNLTASQTHLDFLQSGFLRSLHTLPHALINTLEDAPPPTVPLPPISNSVPPQRQPTTGVEQKKVRGSRVPKGVVPGVTPPPDPERWLKKSERTNLHYHGGKRRRGPPLAATQGTLVEGGAKSSGSKGKKKR